MFSGPGDRPRTAGDVSTLIALTIQKNIPSCSDFIAKGIGNEVLQVFKHHGLRIFWRPRPAPAPPARPRVLTEREEKKARERR